MQVYKGELMQGALLNGHDGMLTHRSYASDHLGGGGGGAPVAIKTLKANASLKTQQDFRREVELMSELRHPNIVCLLGTAVAFYPL